MSIGVAAIVVAAGRGERAGGDLPKQYRPMLGVSALARALRLFDRHPEVDLVQPVIHPADSSLFEQVSSGLDVLDPVFGGATRQESVLAGLQALSALGPDIVLIHDAARPFASGALVSRAIAALGQADAAIPALPITDTVKVIAGERVTATLDRTSLRTVQTPQAFRFGALLAAHRSAAQAELLDFPDDAALAEWAGIDVAVFAGEPGNLKLTTSDDFRRAEAIMLAALSDIRAGSGYDVHAFGPGDHVTLGGVRIPHGRGLVGHSDADVLLHALTDALLGALADGDIGAHFPPSDPQWRNASSDLFLTFACERLRMRGGVIAHLDGAIICEQPRIGPYRDAIRARIAEVACISLDRVAIKATTNEKLGFLGRGEGIAALATATIRLPWDEP